MTFILLKKIKHVLMTCKGKNGDVKGMFIPFEANKLQIIEKKEASVFIVIRLTTRASNFLFFYK